MKLLAISLIALSLQAQEPFQEDKLIVEASALHTISSFQEVDYFTTFARDGKFLWEIPMTTKIVSWKKEGDQIYLFSKQRNNAAFFLTCVDPQTGKLAWEKGIYAPKTFTPEEKKMDMTNLPEMMIMEISEY